MKNNEIETMGSKPTGRLGVIAEKIMNAIHSVQYKEIIDNYIVKDSMGSDKRKVLDIGCGGGIAVKLFSSNSQINKVVGVDIQMIWLNYQKSLTREELVEVQLKS